MDGAVSNTQRKAIHLVVPASVTSVLSALCFCLTLGAMTDASGLRLMTAYIVVGNVAFWVVIAAQLTREWRGRGALPTAPGG